ncbi:Wzz/FepE/Etk N-terminal domain-containing protein [Roseococcus sp. SYP-B2431]|uniref:exopolysaccharide transport family protein n=1 Tax=Roseococcus sp. SYP-B2431 TaxID=2496640 RepID=UPI0013F45488|nr:Wzz/FepE/Etk N-terminal domain-containing protein [Roseococcus sp. SYP-B2431]
MTPRVAGELNEMSSEAWARLRSILATVQHRWRWIAAAFLVPVLIALVLAGIVPPRFTAETLLVVSASRETSSAGEITGGGSSVPPGEVQKLVQSELDLMTSEAVVRRVFTQLPPERIYPQLAQRRLFGLLPPASREGREARAAGMLRSTLFTQAQSTLSNVVRLIVFHPDRALALELLQAVLAAYFELRNEVFANPVTAVLTAELERQRGELTEIENEITALKTRTGVLDIGQEVTLASQRLDQTVQRLDRLREQREAAQATVLAAQTALAAQPGRIVAAVEQTNVPPNDEARNTLSRLLRDRQRMAAQYQPNAPMLVELDGQIERASLQVRENRSGTGNVQTQREVRNPALELLTSRLLAARVDADSIASQEQEVRRQRTEIEQRNMLLLQVQRDLRQLERRREAMEVNFRQFSQREAAARLGEEARLGRGAAVSLAQRPFASPIPRNMAVTFLLAGILAGLGFAAAAALLMTLLRRTWLRAAEAERGTRLPLLGVLPLGRWPVRTGHAAPSIEGLAAQFLDAGLRWRVQLLQFLGTREGDERERLARSLAIELAQAHRKRVLLIDLAGDGSRHFAEVGSPEQKPGPSDEGILAHETMVPRLWIAYQAQNSDLANPHALETNVTRLAERLCQAFDFILVIGPDEMESYVRRRLAVIVDGNILVVREDATRAEAANGMIDRVQASGGRFFGIFYTGAARELFAI